MKIKCPVKNCNAGLSLSKADHDFEERKDNLYYHLLEYHHASVEVARPLNDLLFKIHEMIEKHKYVETELEQVSVVAVLEYLLE